MIVLALGAFLLIGGGFFAWNFFFRGKDKLLSPEQIKTIIAQRNEEKARKKAGIPPLANGAARMYDRSESHELEQLEKAHKHTVYYEDDDEDD